MLKQRLITAAILIPLVIAGILYLPTSIFQWILGGVTLLAAWEWFTIVGLKTNKQRVLAGVALLLVMITALALDTSVTLISAAIIWLFILMLIAKYKHTALPEPLAAIIQSRTIGMVTAIIILTLFWVAAVILHGSSDTGPKLLLYVMIIVWLADTGGYFAGKRWGRTALARVISPNKTWEGVGGALLLGTLWAVVAYSFGLSGQMMLLSWVILSLIALLISIVGDLFESLFKRSHGVKDSGNLLPGHGGMLDRIDSMIAAVPAFVAGLYFMGAL